jgi:outer membrane lipoprotein-sorting protein
VNAPSILQRHRALRWLAPVGVVCVAGLAATGVFKAHASSGSLPRTTPAALIAAVQQSDVTGFSGTVVSQLDLGLPDLPAIGDTGDGTSLTSLLSGSHTLQVWYGGAEKQRIALLGTTDETDVFRDGRNVWQWSSADRKAVHLLVPVDDAQDDQSASASLADPSITPAALAHRALGALDPSTTVAVHTDRTVADRSAYELVLTPRTGRTKIGSVHIAVDGDTKVPLGVQVYARDASEPSIDVSFTSIRFARQPERNFLFSPPPRATVQNLTPDRSAWMQAPAAGSSTAAANKPAAAQPMTTRIGSGWTTVEGLRPGAAAIKKLAGGAALNALTPVSGTWGKGRLLDSALLSVLITNDGWVYAGAVDPSDLYAAAGTK